MPPTRKSQRKSAVLDNTKPKLNRNDTGGTTGAGTAGPSKRKRDVSQDDMKESIMNNMKVTKSKKGRESDPEIQAVIGEKLGVIKNIVDSIETIEELGLTHLQLLDMRKYIQTKIQEKRAYLEELKAKDALQLSICDENKKPINPLMNDVILKRLSNFIAEKDLPSCRLVCHKWNEVISLQLKKLCWTNLTFNKPNSYSRNFPLNDFLTEIKPGSTLFPLTKFTIMLYKIPPSVSKFFSIYSEHVKKLDLRYQPPTDDLASQELYMSGVVKFLLPPLPNCESLYLTNFSCQVFTNTSCVLPKKMNLKHLEVEINCKCSHDDNRHFLTSTTFLTQLIMINPMLESFTFFMDSVHFSDINVQRVITMLISYSNIENLKHVSFRSESFVKIDWLDVQPQKFQLESLELKNVVIVPLHTFLEHHADTLEKLTIDIEAAKWEDTRRNFHGHIFGAPKLKKLKTFSITCLEDQEEGLSTLLISEAFPGLETLKILNINENFVHAHTIKVGNDDNESDDSDSDMDDDDNVNSDKHIQVKNLELEIDDSDSPSDYHFLRHLFYGIQHLTLTTNQSHFITPLWTCGLQLKTLDLRVLYDDAENNDDDEFYIQHLDTIITGFSVNDCERIYQFIMNQFHSTGGFQLNTFNIAWLDEICKDKEYPSIRNFHSLQRLSVTCSRNSSRLTEVTLATLLLCMKTLTAINIANCSISQRFIKHIREQLPLSFFLEIDGVGA